MTDDNGGKDSKRQQPEQEPIKKGYSPQEDTLDPSNPPRSGSGILPDSTEDSDQDKSDE